MYCKCSQYWWRHFKEDSILLSNFVIEGRIIGLKKENEKSFYSLILLEQRFPLKIFLAKYVRILVKMCPVRLFLGEFVRVVQNISKTRSQQAKDTGNCFSLTKKQWHTKGLKIFCHTRHMYVLEFNFFYVKILDNLATI